MTAGLVLIRTDHWPWYKHTSKHTPAVHVRSLPLNRHMYVPIIWTSDLDKIPASFVKQIAARVSSLIRSCHLWFHTLVSLRGERAWVPLKIIRIQSIKLEIYYQSRFLSTFALEMWRLWSRDFDRCLIKVKRELVKRENSSSVIHDLLAAGWSPEPRTCPSD